MWQSPDYLKELRVDTPKLWLELVECYLLDAEFALGDLQRQVSQGDVGAVSKTLHSLKGSSWQIGGVGLGDLIEKTQNSLLLHGIEAVRKAFPPIRAAFELLRCEIKDAINKLAKTGEAC